MSKMCFKVPKVKIFIMQNNGSKWVLYYWILYYWIIINDALMCKWHFTVIVGQGTHLYMYALCSYF